MPSVPLTLDIIKEEKEALCAASDRRQLSLVDEK